MVIYRDRHRERAVRFTEVVVIVELFASERAPLTPSANSRIGVRNKRPVFTAGASLTDTSTSFDHNFSPVFCPRVAGRYFRRHLCGPSIEGFKPQHSSG